MPFKSQAQRKWMHANHPEMAKRWEKETPKGAKLPKKTAKKKSDGHMHKMPGGHMMKDSEMKKGMKKMPMKKKMK